jgi:hypothetical protein
MDKKKMGRPVTKLSCKDIQDLIKCGKEHGAVRLKYGRLEVVYLDGHPNRSVEFNVHDPDQVAKAEEEELSTEELGLKEDELATKAIVDPAEFEALLAMNDLTHKEA